MSESIPLILTPENFGAGQPWLTCGFGTKLLHDKTVLAEHLARAPEKIVTLKQIHSNRVVAIRPGQTVDAQAEGDALVTDCPGLILAVKTADCLPILLYDPVKKVVAAVHAGWRGLANQVLIQTIEVMNHVWGVDVRHIQVAFGPCIQVIHYTVSDDVIEAFHESLGWHFSYEKLDSGQYLVDLACTAAMSLEQSGLPAHNFHFVLEDTFAQTQKFHSYRRDREETGRQLSFIGIQEGV